MTSHKTFFNFILLMGGMVFLSPGLTAQDTLKPAEYFLDDNDLSTAKNCFKIEPLNILMGEYALTYERFLSRTFSAEVTAGMLSSNYRYSLFTVGELTNEMYLEPENPGYVAAIALSLYGSKRHDGMTIQAGYKYRHFTELVTQDIYCSGGYQYVLGDRYPLQFGLDLGVRMQNSLDGMNYAFESDSEFVPYFALRLRFGILY